MDIGLWNWSEAKKCLWCHKINTFVLFLLSVNFMGCIAYFQLFNYQKYSNVLPKFRLCVAWFFGSPDAPKDSKNHKISMTLSRKGKMMSVGASFSTKTNAGLCGPKFGYFSIHIGKNAVKRPVFDASYLGHCSELRGKRAHFEKKMNWPLEISKPNFLWRVTPPPPPPRSLTLLFHHGKAFR